MELGAGRCYRGGSSSGLRPDEQAKARSFAHERMREAVVHPCGSRVVKVSSILASKGSAVVTIKPTDTIAVLSQLLRERRIGAAVVTSDGRSVEGVISERDIAYGLAAHAGSMHALPVAELMTRNVITCSPGDDIAHVASTMLSRHVRHLPVVDGTRVVGMVSMRDVLGLRVTELQQQTAQLRSFALHSALEPQDR